VKGGMSERRIDRAAMPAQIDEVRRLFGQYAEAVGPCECFQGFIEEIADLPGRYAPPTGQLLLAQAGSQTAGCVGLRGLGEGLCEMKRLYVRPEFRDHRLGRELVVAVIAEARQLGYRAMRLDTLPSMGVARALYESLGFHPIARYNDNPSEGVIFLELNLQ